jgi:AcrR family transcriptional regulator
VTRLVGGDDVVNDKFGGNVDAMTVSSGRRGRVAGRAKDETSYHHGDLRRTLIDAAVSTVAASGPADVSLRGLAAAAGVSHAAPVHHFGDKAGLFTAIATEGYDALADELTSVWDETGDFLEVGVRYVHFALAQPGYFEVMFRTDLLNMDDEELVRAQGRAFAMLKEPLTELGRGPDPDTLFVATLSSWSIVHGLATLILSGNLPEIDRADPDRLVRRVIGRLGPPEQRRVTRGGTKPGVASGAR